MPRFFRQGYTPRLLLQPSRWISLLALLIIGLGFTLSDTQISSAKQVQVVQNVAAPTEIRGVWLTNIDSDVLFDPTNLNHALQQLAGLHFNTVYPTVWNWGYTLYPSRVAERTTGYAIDPRPVAAGLKGRDMLAEAIARGHQLGLTVIPWFEFGFMAPADSELATLHPDWLTTRQNGTPTWMEGDDPRVWLNPFKPEVQQFILDLLLEIVTIYDVDGIQLDDHFGLPVEFGYDDFTVQLYQQENPGKTPPANPNDPDWVRWRADKLTEFMQRLFRTLKARKGEVLIALSPNPLPFAYENYLQDWSTWQRRGLIEELTVQIYRSDRQKFLAELSQPTLQMARNHVPTAIGILSGLRNRPVSLEQIQSQVEATRQQGFAGVSFFFYETLWNLAPEPANRRQTVLKQLFTPSVPRPT